MPKFIPLLACLCWSFGLFAQTSFTVDTTIISATYPVNAPVFYPWIELTNNTGQLLEMRCVKVLDQKPAAWETYLEDLDSAYSFVPDTTTFFMPAINQQAQYLIVSFHPHNTVGRSTVQLKLYPANSPTDSVLLTYVGNAYAAPIDTAAAIGEVDSWMPTLSLYPQPANYMLQLKADNLSEVKRLFAVNMLGQKLELPWAIQDTDAIQVSLSGLDAGSYFLVIENGQGKRSLQRFIKQ